MAEQNFKYQYPVLTWEGEGDYQPNFQAPQTAPNQAPDFTPEETAAFENVLQSPPEPELDNIIERLNAYRRLRRTIAKQQGKRLI